MTARVRRERRSIRPWTGKTPPRQLLAIRLHAIGDVSLTIPSLAGLKRSFPGTSIDVLTSSPAAGLFSQMPFVRQTLTFPVTPTRAARLRAALAIAASIRNTSYDCVVDLQRNWVSRLIRRLSGAASWSEFDRFGPRSAHERTLDAIQEAGFPSVQFRTDFPIDPELDARADVLLRRAGWNPSRRLIAVNPAGLWPSRQWPDEHYRHLVRSLSTRISAALLLLGTARIADRVRAIVQNEELPVINLIGQTTLAEAFAILRRVDLIITEDSGLMHLAWAAGAPIVAIFGSSNHVWSVPPAPGVTALHSGDLPCGACMEPECQFHDTHCLRRHTPHRVFEIAQRQLAPPWSA